MTSRWHKGGIWEGEKEEMKPPKGEGVGGGLKDMAVGTWGLHHPIGVGCPCHPCGAGDVSPP